MIKSIRDQYHYATSYYRWCWRRYHNAIQREAKTLDHCLALGIHRAVITLAVRDVNSYRAK